MEGIPQDNTLKWRILKIYDDGHIDLISATPTSTSFYLSGALGYNNGVLLLNDLCKSQYSNTSLEVTARSINLVDIESRMNETGLTARNTYEIGTNIRYGTTEKHTGLTPEIYTKDIPKTTAGESLNYYASPTLVKPTNQVDLPIKNTHYEITSKENYYDTPNFHEIIFVTTKPYWLASRYAFASVSHGEFRFTLYIFSKFWLYPFFKS